MALTSDIQRIEKEGRLQVMPVKAGVVIFKGALLKVIAGYLAPCAAEVGAVYAGVAYEAVSNSAGVDGEVSIRVERKRAFEMEGAAFTQADLYKSVFASDDNTVSTTQATNEQDVGVIIEVISATKVLVAQNNI